MTTWSAPSSVSALHAACSAVALFHEGPCYFEYNTKTGSALSLWVLLLSIGCSGVCFVVWLVDDRKPRRKDDDQRGLLLYYSTSSTTPSSMPSRVYLLCELESVQPLSLANKWAFEVVFVGGTKGQQRKLLCNCESEEVEVRWVKGLETRLAWRRSQEKMVALRAAEEVRLRKTL